MATEKSTARRGAPKTRAIGAANKSSPVGLTLAVVEQRVGDADPASIKSKYVVVNGRRYPPSQVMELVLGSGSKGITSAIAQRHLQRLGLVVGHLDRSRADRRAVPDARSIARSGVTGRYTNGARARASTAPERLTRGSAGATSSTPPDARGAFEAELRAHVGEWVAVRDDRLLIAAPDAKTVVSWLSEHAERADMMYKVPADLSEVSGSAA
jgi:hypothetical protein